MADFTPRKPEIQVHWDTRTEGPFDLKDRDMSTGLWLVLDQDDGSERLTKDGRQQFTAKKGDRRFRGFVAEGWKLVKTEDSENQSEGSWDD